MEIIILLLIIFSLYFLFFNKENRKIERKKTLRWLKETSELERWLKETSELEEFKNEESAIRLNPQLKETSELEEFKNAYFKKPSFMTKSEFCFFEILQKNLPKNHIIFCKVRIEDFIGVHKQSKQINRFRGYIKSRHIDFLICDQAQMKPILAIELDGKSHKYQKQQEIDERKDKICEAVRLRLERVKVGEGFQTKIQNIMQYIK